jgi:hypothetical protein
MSRIAALFAVAVCALTMVATAVLAATSREKIPGVLEPDIAVKRTEMMSRAVFLSRAEADAFWPVYREYDRGREELEARAVRLVDEYTESYQTLDDAKARALLDRLFQLHEQRLALLRWYAEQLQAKLPMQKAAGFVLTEFQLLLLLDQQRTADLGLIR